MFLVLILINKILLQKLHISIIIKSMTERNYHSIVREHTENVIFSRLRRSKRFQRFLVAASLLLGGVAGTGAYSSDDTVRNASFYGSFGAAAAATAAAPLEIRRSRRYCDRAVHSYARAVDSHESPIVQSDIIIKDGEPSEELKFDYRASGSGSALDEKASVLGPPSAWLGGMILAAEHIAHGTQEGVTVPVTLLGGSFLFLGAGAVALGGMTEQAAQEMYRAQLDNVDRGVV